MRVYALILLLYLNFSACYPQEYNEDYIAFYKNLGVDKLANLFKNATNVAENYELPTSAYQYAARNSKPVSYGEYDYIIVGAGGSGCVLANRLSESTNFTILIIEAGSVFNELTNIPGLYAANQFSEYNWGFMTTPQKYACLGMKNKRCTYPRGKGVGGSTLLNGMIYTRGYCKEYENWAKFVNDDEWNCENTLKEFKKFENFNKNQPKAVVKEEYHGVGGEMNVEYHLPTNMQLEQWLKANEELGYEMVDYMADGIGASYMVNNVKHGIRWDTGKAFLVNVLNRPNLELSTNSYAIKVDTEKFINDDDVPLVRATSVQFTKYNTLYYAKARKEIILCAGTIQSPQLLMLSGIGPSRHLDSVGIETVLDLEVGSYYKDHPLFFGMTFQTNASAPIKTIKENMEDFLKGEGSMGVPLNNKGIGFYVSKYGNEDPSIPNIELVLHTANASDDVFTPKTFGLTDESFEDLSGDAPVSYVFNYDVITLTPKSIGEVRLQCKNPYDYPLIDTKYLSDKDDYDINVIYEALQLVLKFCETKALQAIDCKFASKPLRYCVDKYEFFSKDYWFCTIRHYTTHVYHPMSTCRMGTNPPESIVNSKGVVYGTANLRVADASIIPTIIAGHPQSVTMMIGQKIARFIRDNTFK